MKNFLILSLLSTSVFAQEIRTRCRAYCVQVNYDLGRISLLRTITSETRYSKARMFFRMEDQCTALGADTYLVKNFDISTRRALSSSESNSSSSSVSVGGSIEARNGFLGIGRRRSVSAQVGTSRATSHSQSSSSEVDFDFKLDFSTMENSCLNFEHDPNEPVRYVGADEIFG